MAEVTNILVVGTGGQGVMTAAEILAEAALAEGHDVKKTEVAGMSQRGGVVSSHLRFGPRVLSPQISPGCADLLLGFEAAEGLRWQHMLRPDGLALINLGRLVPPVVESSVSIPISSRTACCTAATKGPGVVRKGLPPSVHFRSYSSAWRSRVDLTRALRLSAVDSVQKRKLKSTTIWPGMTLPAPVPAWILLI